MSTAAAARPAPEYRLEGAADPWTDWRRTAGLVRHLTRRHLAARYRGSALGFLWSLLNPLLMMVVYTLVFQYIFRLSAPGVPYPVFFLTGLLAWGFVHTATMNAATSIVDNLALLHKARFPSVALPLAAVLSNLVNYLVSLPVLLGFGLAFGVAPGARLLLLPLALVLLLAIAVGLALIVAALTPFFRDTVQLLEVLFVGWFFATPVLYPTSLPRSNLPGWAHRLYELNPMAGAISLVRAVFLDEPLPLGTLAAALPGTALLLALGWWVFRRTAARFTSAG